MKWKPSNDGHTETHDGAWKIRPRYWGRVRATEYALTHHDKAAGNFDTQRAAKAKAAELSSANGRDEPRGPKTGDTRNA